MSLRIAHILFPTDFSPASENAGKTAADFARHFGATLHIVHVVPPVTDPTPSPRALGDAVARLAPDLPVVSEILSGPMARRIVGYAKRTGIDLIVVGTHGRTGVSHLLLGSVAEAVVRRAPCRVLTVPSSLEAPAPAAPSEAEAEARCIVCGRPSPDLVCEACRALIRGEALEGKLRVERSGRVPGSPTR
jgi:nucleotide-binding universal stress UspA family protein